MATIRERISSRRSPRSRSSPFVGRCGKRSHPDPERSRVTQTYDAIGQRSSLNDPTGITTYTYDPDSRLSTQTSPNGMRLTDVYQGVGQRKSLSEPEGGRFSYTYDPAGRKCLLSPRLPSDDPLKRALSELQALKCEKDCTTRACCISRASAASGNRLSPSEMAMLKTAYTAILANPIAYCRIEINTSLLNEVERLFKSRTCGLILYSVRAIS